MQVGKADVLRLVDDDRIRVRDVQAVLDDGRTQEHVVVAPHEIQHLVLQFLRFHLPVRDADFHIRNEPVQDVVDGREFFHFIM